MGSRNREAMADDGLESEPGSSHGERGAGGKLLTRQVRKVYSTPYARPQDQTVHRKDDWISKIADPASRLASRLFSSLFRKTQSDVLSDADEESMHMDGFEVQRPLPDGLPYSNHGTDGEEDTRERNIPHFDCHTESEVDNGSQILEIEHFMKQKTFTKDEFESLTKLLQARTLDFSCKEKIVEESHELDPVSAEAVKRQFHQEKFKIPIKEKTMEQNNRISGKSLNSCRSHIDNDIGRSPVEIAKAFMGTRTVENGIHSWNVQLRDGQIGCHDMGSHSVLPSPATSLGARIHDFPYYIPQTQRRTERTPYLRTTSKGDGGRPLNLSSVKPRQQQTPLFSTHQAKIRRVSSSDDHIASVGVTSATPKKALLSSPEECLPYLKSSGLPSSTSHVLGLSLSTFSVDRDQFDTQKNKGVLKFVPANHKQATNLLGSSVVHPRSSEMARKILEHLNRTIPSPKEKLEELKLVRSRSKESTKLHAGMVHGVHRDDELQSKAVFDNNSNYLGTGTERASGVTNEAAATTTSCTGIEFSQKFFQKNDGNQSSPDKVHEQADKTSHFHQMGKQLNISGSTQSLTPLFIRKPDGTQAIGSLGDGFTFPVASISCGLCEPPTPTVVQPLIASRALTSREIPSFSFGSQGTKRGPNFSTARASAKHDSLALEFKFGSETKKRLSFRPSG